MKIIDFLNECHIFFVLTINDNAPTGRPFGAVMEYENKLYISTSNTKDVYHQLNSNKHIQLIALKNGTRKWVRVNGKAEECFEFSLKELMLQKCPSLTKRFPAADCEYFALFEIEVLNAVFYDETGSEILR